MDELNLNGKSLLVTGGTGSFGKKFIGKVFESFPQVRRVVVYSRDELKQYEMSQNFPACRYPAIRFFIGDVRDAARLVKACEGIDIIVHAAALKHVPIAEYNPMECIKTNVLGAQNVIDAALATQVKKIVALSTDKAAAPVNLYGASKLCSDKLFIAANNMRGSRDLAISVVRYGNVLGSRGSIIPFFQSQVKNGVLPITHKDMTRFSISLSSAVDLVFFALQKALGGETFVPKMPSYRVVDVAKAIGPDCEQKIVGIRPGEKLHEDIITSADALNTIDCGNCFIVCPTTLKSHSVNDFAKYHSGILVNPDFSYSSGINEKFLTVEELRSEIKEHVE